VLLNHPQRSAPIAIYDSGVGGLAITRTLKAFLPQERIHYIGDTKNLPYGQKTATALCGYIKQVVNFCLNKHYKLLVLACHTAAAAAVSFVPSYLKSIGRKIDMINVIDPVVTYITTASTYHHIGLIGTPYTVTHGSYTERLQAAGITLSALATPLLAPMVEAYFDHGKIDNILLHNYLDQLPCQNIDALVSACTHYIFLEKAFKSFFKDHYQRDIAIIDAAQLTALAVKAFLNAHNLLNHTAQKLPDCFMATALTPAFKNASKQLFGAIPIEIDLEPYAT
jgi:glutamate racemase